MAWYYFLRWYVRLGLKFYFRKIVIRGSENIPSHAVIFAANHQNAFMDALLMICFNAHVTNSLTRADIFRGPFTKWLLSSLRLIPIYRIRDGWQSLDQNQETFQECYRRFVKNEAVIIFPEGNHGGQRRLRPLSRGFTRLVFETLRQHPDLPLSIVPVGINYSSPQDFRGDVSLYFGKPMAARDYFKEPLPVSANQFREDLADRMKTLITHVGETLPYDETIRALEATHPNFLDPVETNRRLREISVSVTSPPVANEAKQKNQLSFLYSLASVINIVPLAIWRSIRSKIKDPIFTTSLRFGVGIFLFPAWYVFGGLLLLQIFPLSISILFWTACLISIPLLTTKQPSA